MNRQHQQQHQQQQLHHASTSLLQLPIPQHGGGGTRGGMMMMMRSGSGCRTSASASPTPSEEEYLLLPPDSMLRPKYSLNLRPEDCGAAGMPPSAINVPPPPITTPPARFQARGKGAPVKTIPRVSTLAQVNRHLHQHQHQNSTDSAPASAAVTDGDSHSSISGKKRKEMWTQAGGPCSFHQSFDIRTDPMMLSNSCGNIIDDQANAATAARCFRTERRAAFCSGESSRDPRSGHAGHGGGMQQQQAPLYCTAPACSGHAPCPLPNSYSSASGGGAQHHRPPLRSAHSSFDESDPSGQGHRDTYLSEISREWMLMNGAIAPFKNILQQASSITNTPLANHRQIQQQQQQQQSTTTGAGPAGPAAAAAVNTATAIIGNRVGTKLAAGASGDDDWMGPFATSHALRGSCHNLAALTAAATTSPLVFEQFNRQRKESFSSGAGTTKADGGGQTAAGAINTAGGTGAANTANNTNAEPIIIIEPKANEEGDPLLKKSLSLVLKDDDDVEAQRQQQQQQQPAANGPTAGTGSIFGSICGGTAGAGGGSEKGGGGGPGSVLMDDSCSVKQPLMKEKERGGRFVKRQQLFNKRRVTSDYALFFALFGIVLMIVENEFAYEEYTTMCNALKTVILLSTIILVGLVVKFHVHEIQIFMNANSAEDWQIALTGRKTMQILVEIIACAICPLPIQMDVFVTTVNADGQAIPMRMPLDVLFSILMFFRLYWLCRVMLLHSRLFTDAASRSIAGLNRVKTDAKFILKTLMTICPGTVLMLFTATLWMIGGYILRLCERHHMSDGDPILLSVQAEKHQSYLNSLWLIAVTFLSIGYGDIVPNTQCGRIMAVVTGILGTCTSSMVVAVIARKLELTRAEKHVHNFMIESQHTKEMKHIAANVLRETWLIYKHRRLVEKIDASKIRYHQRKFLVAICALRKLKTSQRKLDENRVSLGDVAKTTSHSHELMRDVHTTQEGVALRITAVEHQLSDIQRELNSISELLKFALRPALEYSCAQQQQQQQQQFQQQSPMMTPTIATTMPMPSVGSMGAGFGTCGGTQNPMMEFRQRQRKPSTTISEPLG